MPHTTILVVGQDPALLETRGAILRTAGCVTIPALSIDEAIVHFVARDFDLVLLCHSMPAPNRYRLTSLIRATGSLTPVVTVAPLTGQVPDSVTDATIAAEPERFLSGIEDACSRRAKMYQMPDTISAPNSMRAARVDRAARSDTGHIIKMQPPPATAGAPSLSPNRDQGARQRAWEKTAR
jgi:CheY-like chemotaxis protein